MYYLLSLLTGILISVMVAFNGGLTEQFGVYSATVIIHIAGLLLISIMAISKRERLFSQRQTWFLYLGGIFGVCVVLLSNITVTKISAFYLSLFLFIGQVFSGILIDAVIAQTFSLRNLIGGIFVAAGLCINLLLDRRLTFLPKSGIISNNEP
ncbi:MAG: DMT family transporter [Treponema sp.]|nr:DMT family transporter [Treponema sp.]